MPAYEASYVILWLVYANLWLKPEKDGGEGGIRTLTFTSLSLKIK
jgi:hypothetical protein